MTDPIARIETATTASAISTSMIVKPASWLSIDGVVARCNFDPPGQPIDANLIADVEPRQRDGTAARHAVCKEADGRQRLPSIASARQRSIDANIIRYPDHVRACAC